jgi:hypothetical protein
MSAVVVHEVDDKWRKDSRSICKAGGAHQGPVRTGKNGTPCTASVPRVLNQDSNKELDAGIRPLRNLTVVFVALTVYFRDAFASSMVCPRK